MKTNKNIAQPERQRTSIVIEGIDTSTPDDLVKDGKCSELHNLRFKDSAWRPVHQHPIKTKIRLDDIFYNEEDGGIFPDTAKVVYHHPAAGEGTYIVETVKDGKYSYYSIKDTFSSPDDTQGALIATFNEMMKISHFGKVLLFNNGTSVSYYIFDVYKERYELFTYPPYVRTYNESTISSVPPTYVQITTSHSATHDYTYMQWADFVKKYKGSSGFEYQSTPRVSVWYKLFDIEKGIVPSVADPSLGDLTIGGEFAAFTTFMMEDGTPLSPSPIHIFCPQTEAPSSTTIIRDVFFGDDPYDFQNDMAKGTDDSFGKPSLFLRKRIKDPQDVISGATIGPDLFDNNVARYTRPILRMVIPKDIYLHSSIKTIAIWSTREYHMWASSRGELNFNERKDGSRLSWAYKDNKLASQPFYKIAEIEISKFEQETIYDDVHGVYVDTDNLYYNFVFGADAMQDVPSAPLYVPFNNINTIIKGVELDYNQCKHIANATIKLAPPYAISESIEDISGNPLYCSQWVEIHTNNDIYKSLLNNSVSVNKSSSIPPRTHPFALCLSHPDYRAKKISIYFDLSDDFTLTPHPANNWATYHHAFSDAVKYPTIDYGGKYDISEIPKNDNIYVEPNKILVSSANNPFSWPFGNTYSVGSNNSKILALQSAVIEMTDSKFGEMPLYAFTEEGIFALQAGESTLYSSVIPINYDRIINPNVLAINYNLAYITEKGLHLLNGNGSTLISQPLDTIDGSPLDMWSKVKLLNPQSFNEIVCYDEESKQAYIFNLDYQYWCTRDMQGLLINNSESVLTDGTIFDITQEDNNPETPYRLETRPIKLGDLEFKRLETIIPRMRVTSTTDKMYSKFKATLYVDAAYQSMYKSEDEIIYPILRFEAMRKLAFPDNDPRGIVIRRTPYSAQYFRMRFYTDEAETSEIALSNIDVEWYHKFLRRMR